MSPTETAKMKDFGLAIGPGELGKEVFMNLKADLTIADESIKELSPVLNSIQFTLKLIVLMNV